DLSERVETAVKAQKGLYANVDFYSASLYRVLGIPTDLFTPVFAVSRIAGWTAHVLEQLRNNRLIRPESEYTGPRDVAYVPLERRNNRASGRRPLPRCGLPGQTRRDGAGRRAGAPPVPRPRWYA